MPLHLRQICLATGDLETTAARLETVLSGAACYSDPDVAQLGVRNRLFQIGTDFLELVSPLSPQAPLQRFLDRRGGDGGYMAITQTETREEQAEIRARAAELGIRIAWELTHRGADFLQWNPADTGGSFLETSFDHAGELDGRWSAAGGAIGAATPFRLAGIEVTTADPARTAATWGALTGIAPGPDGGLHLRNARIGFVAATGGAGGLTALHLRSPEAGAALARAATAGLEVADDSVTLCGLRLRITA